MLINALNERFGMNLTDADRIWFEQQEAHLREDDDVASRGAEQRLSAIQGVPRAYA